VALSECGYPIEEVPIDWQHIPGSKVSPLKDSVRMVNSLLVIRKRRRAGAYKNAAL
jgi:dolichyl-phosphate beta-glucosyltransferase